MNIPASLKPIGPGEPATQLWEVAWARGVSRSALRAHLGDPCYVETDSHRTFGGEEDWWTYRTAAGLVVAVYLRVPYEDALLCFSDPTERLSGDAVALLSLWTIEVLDEPRRR